MMFASKSPRDLNHDHAQHNAPNPHLVALRNRLHAPDAENEIYWATRGVTRTVVWLNDRGRDIPAQLDHAHRVLARLANLTEGVRS